MKKIYLLIPVFLVFIFTQCSSIKVSTDLDRTVDFGKYHTFSFSSDIEKINLSGINQRRLKDAIAAQLQSKGYVLSDNPSLLVNAFIKGNTKTTATATTNHFGYPFGYYGWGSSHTYVDINKYTEGTLFIDLFDVQEKRLVWEGIAEGLVNPRKSSTEKSINKVVAKIFNNFPH